MHECGGGHGLCAHRYPLPVPGLDRAEQLNARGKVVSFSCPGGSGMGYRPHILLRQPEPSGVCPFPTVTRSFFPEPQFPLCAAARLGPSRWELTVSLSDPLRQAGDQKSPWGTQGQGVSELAGLKLGVAKSGGLRLGVLLGQPASERVLTLALTLLVGWSCTGHPGLGTSSEQY